MKDTTYLSIVRRVYGRMFCSAFEQTVLGRLVDPAQIRGSRFLDYDVDVLLADTLREFDRLLPASQLQQYRNRGSQANVVAAALTVANYHALRAFGLQRDYATDLVGDAMWRAFTKLARVSKAVAKVRARDPQGRLNFVLKMLVRFPFTSAGPPGAGRPGYEAQPRWEADVAYTTYTSCAPLNFVRQYIDEHGDDGELQLFQQTWCTYDWPFVDFLVGRPARYERPHTLSFGDDRCDMVWSATPRAEELLPMAPSKPARQHQPG